MEFGVDRGAIIHQYNQLEYHALETFANLTFSLQDPILVGLRESGIV